VALNLLAAPYSQNQVFRQRLYREARAAGSLVNESPNSMRSRNPASSALRPTSNSSSLPNRRKQVGSDDEKREGRHVLTALEQPPVTHGAGSPRGVGSGRQWVSAPARLVKTPSCAKMTDPSG
jgi:hypothetical protein